MLHFFRKIRRDLLANSQFFKYLKYAVGEIVLVVLGILIALYINNENEKRKEQEKFNEILVEVEEELISNVENAIGCMTYLIGQDSLNIIIVNNGLTRAQLEEDSFFQFRSLFGTAGFEIEDKVFKQLMENSNSLTEMQDSIAHILTKLYNTDSINYAKMLNQRSLDLEFRNYSSLKKYDWYNDYTMGKAYGQKEIDYYLNDLEFENNAVEYIGITMDRHFYWIETWFQKFLKSYNLVYNYLENHNIQHNDSLHFSFNPQDYKHWIGKYKAVEHPTVVERNYPNIELSSEIELLNDQFFIKLFANGNPVAKTEIFPLTSSCFIPKSVHVPGYYRIRTNKLKQATIMEHNFGRTRVKSEKIR